jgi:hypothetical protein
MRLRRPSFRAAPEPTSWPLIHGLPRHSPAELEREAIRWGECAGVDAAEGRHHAERISELPGRRLVEESGTLRLAEIEVAVGRELSDLRADAASAERRERDAAAVHAHEAATVAELDAQLRDSEPNRAPHIVFYLLVLALLASAEFPTVSSALRAFPADHTTRVMLALALSGVLACAAHFLAHTLRAAIDARAAGQHRRREAHLQTAVAVVFTIAVVGLVALMGLSRGQSFQKIAQLSGGVFGDPQMTSWMLLALQVVLLAIALALALLHAHGHEARRLTRALRRARKRERRAKAQHDATAVRRSAADQRLADLPQLADALRASEGQLRERNLQLHDAHYIADASRRPNAPVLSLHASEAA